MAAVARPLMPRHSSTPALQSRDAVTKVTREDTRALREFFNETAPPVPIPIDTIHQRTSSFGASSIGKAKAKKLGLFKSKKKAEADDKKGNPRILTPPPGTVAITLNSGHTVYMIGQPVPPPIPPPVLSADTEAHLEHIIPSSSVPSAFSTGPRTPGTPALTSRSLSFSSASPSPSYSRPPLPFSQSEVYLNSSQVAPNSYPEVQTRLAAARSTGRLDTIYSITSMQSEADEAFLTAPNSPSEAARRSRHMSVGLIYEGGSLATILGSPHHEEDEEVEDEDEQTIDLHNPVYNAPTWTSSSTDNALQFTPRPINPMSHRRVVSSTPSLIRKVDVATSPIISEERTYQEIGVQTTESPLLPINGSNLSISPSPRGTRSTPTTPVKRAKAAKQGLPTPPPTSTSLNNLPREGSFTSLRPRKRSKSNIALASPTKFGMACDDDDPVEIRDILQMEDREEAIRELKDLYTKTKYLKEEGERYQNMRAADQAAGLAGVTLACTVLCEELKQHNLTMPVEKLMTRERSLCVPGAEYNLLEMARANKVALDILSGYTSSGVMRIGNGSMAGLLVPGLSPTPSFSSGLAALGEGPESVEVALDASRFAMLGKEKDFSMIKDFHANKVPSPATQFSPSPEVTAEPLSTDVSSSSVGVPGPSSPGSPEQPVESPPHSSPISPWPNPGESRLLLRHIEEPDSFLLVDGEARVDPIKEAEKTKRQSESLLDKIEQLEREWSSSKDGMELKKLSEQCGPPMCGISEEDEYGETRPLSVGFPWVTRNPFAEAASHAVGDGVQESPLVIEPTQVSPKNSTTIYPADTVAIVRRFPSPSLNIAAPDVIDSQRPEERRSRPLQTKSFLARVETLTNFHLATHLDDEALKLLTDPSPPITPVDAAFPRGIGSLSDGHPSVEKMPLPSKEGRAHSIAMTSVSGSPSSVHRPFTLDDPKWNAYLSPSGSQVREERKKRSRLSTADSAMLDEATKLLLSEAEDSGSDYGEEDEAAEGRK